MKTFVCHKCTTRVCVCAVDESDDTQKIPIYCPFKATHTFFNPVSETEDPEHAE